MTRLTTLALAISLSLSFVAATAGAQETYLWQASGPIAPGVSHARILNSGGSGEMAVHAVTVDLTNPAVALESSTALERASAAATVLEQGLRHSRDGHRTVASINGGTFFKGATGQAGAANVVVANGLSITDGELVAFSRRSSDELWPALGIDDGGRPVIGAPAVELTLTLADSTVVRLAQVNRLRGADEAVLYTPRFGSTTLTEPDGVEIVLVGAQLPLRPYGEFSATVSEVRRGQGDTAIGPTGLVVSASGQAANALTSLAAGDQVQLEVEIDNEWRNVEYAVSGRELLLDDGEVDVRPSGNKTYAEPHPRTAVGVTADGRMLLVTIDGRQAHSRGATIPETARLMRDLGANYAINLDGGGSTTLAVREPGNVDEQVVNSPSEPDRLVSNALHVVSSAPTGPPTGLAIVPAGQRMSVGDELQLRVGAYDAAYNGVALDLGVANWSVSGSVASVNQSGLLTALAPGDVTVSASAGGWSATAAVHVVNDGLAVSPPVLSFVSGSSAGLHGMPINVSWGAVSPRSTLRRVELERRTGSGPWRKVSLGGRVAESKLVTLKFGSTYQFRVRATDELGEVTEWAVGERIMIEVIDDRATTISFGGAWTGRTSSQAIGGRFARSSTVGATMSLNTGPVSFAVIGQRGRGHGMAEILTGRVRVGMADLRSSSLDRRWVIYGGVPSEFLPLGPMTISVRNSSVGSRTRVEIDALVLLTSLD